MPARAVPATARSRGAGQDATLAAALGGRLRVAGEGTGPRSRPQNPPKRLWPPCASDLLHEINHTILEEKNLNF